MTWTLLSELLAFVVYFLYGSFFEWVFHKYLFHSPRFLKATFRAHTLIHHQVYKYEPASYEWREGPDRTQEQREHVSMDWFALPLFLGFHLPFFWAIEHFTGWKSMWGGLAAIAAYYIIYEYFHFCMHVPGQRWFERTRLFRFVKEHHRIHHKYMLQNLNVFFPLADLCLGTFRSAASVPKKVMAPPVPNESTHAVPAGTEELKTMRQKSAATAKK